MVPLAQSEPPVGCWGCFALKAGPCWMNVAEAPLPKVCGSKTTFLWHQEGSRREGRSWFCSNFATNFLFLMCLSFLMWFVQTPSDLFSSFYPSVAPSVYTIYMGKDKYESKYSSIAVPNGSGLIWGV